MPRETKDLISVAQYEAMGYKTLHKELQAMIARESRVIRWFNKTAQFDLLPALSAMHNLTAKPGIRTDLAPLSERMPNWELECTLLGISPGLVRIWKHRTASETDIRHLLGERPAQSNGKSEDYKAKYNVAVKHLREIIRLVENGKFEKLEDVAAALEEYYEI